MQDDQLRMLGRITAPFDGVSRGRDDVAVHHRHGSHGNFASPPRRARKSHRMAEVRLVLGADWDVRRRPVQRFRERLPVLTGCIRCWQG